MEIDRQNREYAIINKEREELDELVKNKGCIPIKK
jgi:hypothetical protein